MKMIVEPTGCLSLAGAQAGGLDLKGARVGVLVSGGNIDLGRFAELVSSNLCGHEVATLTACPKPLLPGTSA